MFIRTALKRVWDKPTLEVKNSLGTIYQSMNSTAMSKTHWSSKSSSPLAVS